ncbi:MAG: 3-hydroxy acid dehydrogenase/malonic semialdehyde reductase [Planctomycetota bacterium]|jgi:3-hydroxy acid dehydrogenase/malonic semialdehyde reductase
MIKVKRALVTGASSGIGMAICNRLLAQKFAVVGLSRRGMVDQLDDPNFSGYSIDLEDIDNLAKQLSPVIDGKEFDCFVHCAGSGRFGSVEQFSVAQIDQSIRLNLTSALILSRAIIPGFRRNKKGRVIFIGSESSLTAGKKGALYSAAKFGLRGFSQALREDCAKDGIQVSLINPGMVRSPFFDSLSFRPGDLAENAISPDDVARVVTQILESSTDIVFDEINLSPRVKSINFSKNDD